MQPSARLHLVALRNVLSSCAANCQACYNADLTTIKSLKIGTITIYQPNYYILKAAKSSGIKVVLGLYDDSVSGLAQPNTATNCTYGGQPFPYCGTKYATALFGGTCGNVTPWAPATFCESSSTNPNATYVAALNSSAGQFLQNGTVVGIQLGNEILGLQSAATITHRRPESAQRPQRCRVQQYQGHRFSDRGPGGDVL